VISILRCIDISKIYPNGIRALNEINIEIKSGEIHAIVGENGAGKSTLMNILFGMTKPTSGKIVFMGKEVVLGHPSKAIQLGIGMVHQHFKLVPSLTVMENVILGNENQYQNKLRVIDRKKVKKTVKALIDEMNIPLEPTNIVENLPISKQQLVEILKVLYKKAKFVIFDEPTSVLAPSEVDEFLNFVLNLKNNGKTVIFISHRLEEVFKIADRITILRKGTIVGTFRKDEITINEVANLMVGSQINLNATPPSEIKEECVLEIKELSSINGSLKDINLKLHKGEILGIAGVGGNGQEELFEILSTRNTQINGEMLLERASIVDKSLACRRDAGIAFITDDRIKNGLAIENSILENCIAGHHRYPKFGKVLLNIANCKDFTSKILEKYAVKNTGNIYEKVKFLSGGNMQKLLVGRELEYFPKLLIASQPTAGVDIHAKNLIHDFFRNLVKNGGAILLISGDLEELMSLSNRILVLYRGKVVAKFRYPYYDPMEMSYYMTGIKESAPSA